MSSCTESPERRGRCDSSFSTSLSYPFSTIHNRPRWVPFYSSSFPASSASLSTFYLRELGSLLRLDLLFSPHQVSLAASFVSRARRWDRVIHTSAYSTNCSVKNARDNHTTRVRSFAEPFHETVIPSSDGTGNTHPSRYVTKKPKGVH